MINWSHFRTTKKYENKHEDLILTQNQYKQVTEKATANVQYSNLHSCQPHNSPFVGHNKLLKIFKKLGPPVAGSFVVDSKN